MCIFIGNIIIIKIGVYFTIIRFYFGFLYIYHHTQVHHQTLRLLDCQLNPTHRLYFFNTLVFLIIKRIYLVSLKPYGALSDIMILLIFTLYIWIGRLEAWNLLYAISASSNFKIAFYNMQKNQKNYNLFFLVLFLVIS